MSGSSPPPETHATAWRPTGSARGIRAFPEESSFLLILAREALDRGVPAEALGFVERALAIEPTNSVALQLAITAYARTGAVDSAFATARRALAANVPSDAVGASLLTIVSPALSAAQTSQARADWETALRLAQAVDTVASSPRSAFYVGSRRSDRHRRDPIVGRAHEAADADACRSRDGVRVGHAPRGSRAGRDDRAAARWQSRPGCRGQNDAALPGYSEFVTSVKRANCR